MSRPGSFHGSPIRARRLSLAIFALALLTPGPASAHDLSAAQTAQEPSPFDVSAPFAAAPANTAPEPPLVATPRAKCGPGAWPETGIQGRVSREDHENGLAARGFRCNTKLVGSLTKEPPNLGSVGGYKVVRYVDHSGNECAFYDTSLLPPANVPDLTMGVRVVDMADPTNPQLSTILTTPAMEFPHESLVLNDKRGVLAAVAGNLSQAVLPGIVDLYDISQDCLHPALKSSTPTGVYGHESAMSPDGKTFYSASFSTGTLVAVDITNLSAPIPLWFGRYDSHGLSISDDGTRAYIAKDSNFGNFGMITLDTSEIQDRVPNPQVPEVSFLTWKSISIPQSTVPITIGGHPFVVESDEFGAQVETGGARLIDIGDEAHPQVISDMRLQVMQPKNFEAQAGDPGVDTPFQFAQGYTGHFCNVPTRVDPPIVACGMSVSGLRIFDIRDPYHPKEVAYYNAPVKPRTFPEGSNWAYSSPAFAPERKEVWYSDAYTGFYDVKLTNGVWPNRSRPVIGECAGAAASLVRGKRAAERLHGTNAPDQISGRGGDDKINARESGDCVHGGAGADDVKGGSGSDRIRGGADGDLLRGGSDSDRLTGANGGDRLHGAKGDDLIRGGNGDDLVDGGVGSNRLFCGAGHDVAIARSDGDIVDSSCEVVR